MMVLVGSFICFNLAAMAFCFFAFGQSFSTFFSAPLGTSIIPLVFHHGHVGSEEIKADLVEIAFLRREGCLVGNVFQLVENRFLFLIGFRNGEMADLPRVFGLHFLVDEYDLHGSIKSLRNSRIISSSPKTFLKTKSGGAD